jgi:hypothetical protein
MSEIEMKVGEWYENTRCERLYCGLEIPVTVRKGTRFVCYRKDGGLKSFTDDGRYYDDRTQSSQDIVRHLPGCTGFDWEEPKFKVGDVVYATKPENTRQYPIWACSMDELQGKALTVTHVRKETLDVKGSVYSFHHDWLSKEPPAAQYRAFANEEEYAPHFDRKVLRQSKASPEAKGQYRIGAFDESKVWTTDGVQCTYAQMLKDGRKFADTNEPFGVKIN